VKEFCRKPGGWGYQQVISACTMKFPGVKPPTRQ